MGWWKLFGYVRPHKGAMRVCEFEAYKAVYCGLCKELGAHYGQAVRMTLSYDFAFLAVMNIALDGENPTACRERCVAHPMRKCVCAHAQGIGFPAGAAVLLVWHKLADDAADKGFLKAFAARIGMLAVRRSFKKAKAAYPALEAEIAAQMKNQSAIERAGCANLDEACEASAKMMEAIARELPGDEAQQEILARFGYFLGKYVYLCDALDDARDDWRSGGYNPLLLSVCGENKPHPKHEELPPALHEKLCDYAQLSVNLALGELAEAFTALEVKTFAPVVHNIVYLGLPNTFSQIKSGTFHRKSKREFKRVAD
ncbi:MAG: DUF5685 family protein [Oscillospiraceae bacterium]